MTALSGHLLAMRKLLREHEHSGIQASAAYISRTIKSMTTLIELAREMERDLERLERLEHSLMTHGRLQLPATRPTSLPAQPSGNVVAFAPRGGTLS